jgi:hypothetical protein
MAMSNGGENEALGIKVCVRIVTTEDLANLPGPGVLPTKTWLPGEAVSKSAGETQEIKWLAIVL